MTVLLWTGETCPLNDALRRANITRAAFDAMVRCRLTLQEALIDRNSWRD